MEISDFKLNNRKQWASALRNIFPAAVPQSARWTSIEEIKNVLSKIAQPNLNHMLFPSHGGLDLTAVRKSHEDGCLDLMTGNVAYVVRPSELSFESFPESLAESYFRLELARLEPSGTYSDSDRDHEELVETAPNQFHDRWMWDEQNMGEDEDGNLIPLPPGSRLVVRYFRGTFLLVAKGSMYNSIPATYDGLHSRMTATQLQSQVAEMLKRNQSWIEQMEGIGPHQ